MGSEWTRFLAIGDLHTGCIPPQRLDALFRAASRSPEARFLCVPGDLTNDGRPDQYAALSARVQSLPFPFFGTLGNHDVLCGPDEAARVRFQKAMAVEAPSYSRTFNDLPFLFLSTDGNVDGARIEITRALPLLQCVVDATPGPLVIFCHAPLTGTVGGALDRDCFTSDNPAFGLSISATVRAMIREAHRPVLWICGHTHSPLDSDGLVHTERLDGNALHVVNLSSPYFTGRDAVMHPPQLLYHFGARDTGVEVRIEDVTTGATVREAWLEWHAPAATESPSPSAGEGQA